MENEIDRKLLFRNIKPTAMREMVLIILTEQKSAISMSELEMKFENADGST